MKTFEFESVEESYPVLLKALLEEGNDVSPRGMLTKEISPVGITINNPRKRVISDPNRDSNYGFMIGEFLWMLSGSNDVEHVSHYNKQWLKYTDDNKTLNGAYGQRIFKWDGLFDIWETKEETEDGIKSDLHCEHIIMNQFEKAVEQLKKDPDSRQATIVLFNPVQDYRETKDKPCTNLMRFMIRDGKLNMTVFMRSNDIWMGYVYDIFNFTMLQEFMAGILNVEVGKYTHIADSLHLYSDQFDMAKDIISNKHNNLYTSETMDARIPSSDVECELSKVFNIEASTRLNGVLMKTEIVEEMLKNIKNEYWRSMCALIATYNFRKAKRTQEEMDILFKYVTNEFKDINSKFFKSLV